MNIPCGRVVLLAAVVSFGLSCSVRAQTSWLARHGASWEELQTWIDGDAKGYRLVYLNGYDTGGTTRYAALAIKDGKEWYWGTGSLDYLRKKDAEHRMKRCRPICVTGYLKGRSPEFGVVWVNDGRLVPERFAFNLTEKEYSDRVNLERLKHYMPSMVTGYADGAGSYRFTALFVPAGRAVWEEHHDLTGEQYQKAFDPQSKSHGRPMTVTVYPTPAGLRFAVVFIKDRVEWGARHGLSSEEYQAEFDKMKETGFIPISIAGYLDSNPAGSELFDQVMRQYIKERNIPAGTLAVSRDGKLLLARGYGFADAEGRRPVTPDDPFRLASVTKPITAAAVHKLVREGKLDLDAKAFPLLGLKPLPGQQPDARLNDITIRHLLEHKGGWDREKSFDPMFRPLEIAAALKGPGPVGPADIIRYMMGQPLQFDPGSKESYSNFGYSVLGRVIEKVSGQTYPAYVQKNIFVPLGARSVELGRSLPKYRNPCEPIYRNPGKGRNVLDPQSKDEVPAPDGTFYLEAMDAHGGLIASSRDVLRFLDAYWISGEPRQGNGQAHVFFGRLAGTFTMAMQRPNGVNIAVLFNQDTDPSGRDYFALQEMMRDAADRQTGVALRYAAVWVKDE
ncbi:MAG TPA: serine hydrolase [Gemmataceae bacterium]|nr:serine hydrolase [Gemmataceae bacterium]